MDVFAEPEESAGSDSSSGEESYELPDVKQAQVQTLQSVLGLAPDKAQRLAEAICMLAKEEPDEGPSKKGALDVIIAMGGKKPRK